MAEGESSTAPEYSFDEYKMYYESAEKVTDRRLDMNGRNRSFYTAVAVAIAIAFNWAVANPKYLYVGLVATAVVSFVAIVFSIYWAAQVKDLKRLNAAKFKTLSLMVSYVKFDSVVYPNMTLFDTFGKEWAILEEAGGLQTRPRLGIKALKASGAELFEIYAVRAVFLVFLAASVAAIILRWQQVLDSWRTLFGL